MKCAAVVGTVFLLFELVGSQTNFESMRFSRLPNMRPLDLQPLKTFKTGSILVCGKLCAAELQCFVFGISAEKCYLYPRPTTSYACESDMGFDMYSLDDWRSKLGQLLPRNTTWPIFRRGTVYSVYDLGLGGLNKGQAVTFCESKEQQLAQLETLEEFMFVKEFVQPWLALQGSLISLPTIYVDLNRVEGESFFYWGTNESHQLTYDEGWIVTDTDDITAKCVLFELKDLQYSTEFGFEKVQCNDFRKRYPLCENIVQHLVCNV